MNHAAPSSIHAPRVSPPPHGHPALPASATRLATAATIGARLWATLFALVLASCGMVVEVADTLQPASCVALQPASISRALTITTDGASATATAVSTVRANIGRSHGKWYFEVAIDEISPSSNLSIGVVGSMADASESEGESTGCSGGLGGLMCRDELSPTGAGSLDKGSVVGVAVDMDQGVVHFHANGTWLVGQPGSPDGLALGLSADNPVLFPAITLYAGDRVTARFGHDLAFADMVPPTYEPYGSELICASTAPACDIGLDAPSVPAGIELESDGATLIATPELTGTGAVVANTSRVRGAWYFEVLLQSSAQVAVGVSAAVDARSRPGGLGPGCGLQRTGVYCNGETALSTALNLGAGNVLGVAFDLDAGHAFFRVNDTWVGGRDPALAGEGFALSDILTLAYFPKIALEPGAEVRTNFAGPFLYPPPPHFLPYGVCIIGE